MGVGVGQCLPCGLVFAFVQVTLKKGSDPSPAVKGRPTSIRRCINRSAFSYSSTIPKIINLGRKELYFDLGF